MPEAMFKQIPAYSGGYLVREVELLNYVNVLQLGLDDEDETLISIHTKLKELQKVKEWLGICILQAERLSSNENIYASDETNDHCASIAEIKTYLGLVI